jgi:hypothetical protein
MSAGGIQNLARFDPFLDANQGDDRGLQDGLIHIRIQQRSGRKTLTTVQGIADSYDKKKIVKACKKVTSITSSLILLLTVLLFPLHRSSHATAQSSSTRSMVKWFSCKAIRGITLSNSSQKWASPNRNS